MPRLPARTIPRRSGQNGFRPAGRDGGRARALVPAALLLAASIAFTAPVWAQNTQVQMLERVESLEEGIKDIRRVLEEDLRNLRQSVEGQGGLSGQDLADLRGRIDSLASRIAIFDERLERILGVASDNEFRMLRLEKRVESLMRLGLGQSLDDAAAPASGGRSSTGPSGTGAGEAPASNLDTRKNQETLWSIDNSTLERQLTRQQPAGDEPGEGRNPAAAERSGAGGQASGGVELPSGIRSVLPDGDPDEQYKFALGKALQNDLLMAEQAFSEFIDRNPDSALMADASFWLGRVQFMRGSFEKAALTFSEFQTQWPDDARVEKTVLWIGESVAQFATADEVCELLQSLPNLVPEPTDSFHERLAKLKVDSDCPE